jgi:hypothetical protein
MNNLLLAGGKIPSHFGVPTIGVKVENTPKRVSNCLSANTLNIKNKTYINFNPIVFKFGL